MVKINAVERLRAELADPRWEHEHVAMGTNTDPYQRAEGKFRLTRGIIGELARSGTPFSILTKSAMVTRDLDVLVDAARQVPVRVTFSIGTRRRIGLAGNRTRHTPPTPTARRHAGHGRRRHPDRCADSARAAGAVGQPRPAGARRSRPSSTPAAPSSGHARSTSAAPRGSTSWRWLEGHDPELHARYLKAFRGRTEVTKEYDAWVRAAIAAEVSRHRSSAEEPSRVGIATLGTVSSRGIGAGVRRGCSRTSITATAAVGEEAALRGEAVPVVASVPVMRHPQRGVDAELVAGPGRGDVEQPGLLGQALRGRERHVGGERRRPPRG